MSPMGPFDMAIVNHQWSNGAAGPLGAEAPFEPDGEVGYVSP